MNHDPSIRVVHLSAEETDCESLVVPAERFAEVAPSRSVDCRTCGKPITDPNTAVMRRELATTEPASYIATGPHHAACLKQP